MNKCYGCQNRWVRVENGKAITCHSTCQIYKEFIDANNKEKDLIRQEVLKEKFAYKDYDEIKKLNKFRNKR